MSVDNRKISQICADRAREYQEMYEETMELIREHSEDPTVEAGIWVWVQDVVYGELDFAASESRALEEAEDEIDALEVIIQRQREIIEDLGGEL